jgi:hypothetical protein
MSSPAELEALLSPTFAVKHVRAALGHYQSAVEAYQTADWETSIAKAGKFVEATLKALALHAQRPVPSGRGFKADVVIRSLENLAVGSIDDSIRLSIPRACRFMYDIASNRGGRHDPQEVDPNQMDSAVLVSNCSWVLAEMLRYSQKGALDVDRVRDLVELLVVRRYPIVETVDGRFYYHAPKKTARDVALVALWHAHPGRVARVELVALMERHGFSNDNARKTCTRLRGCVDDDGAGNLLILTPGLNEADAIMGANRPT